MVVVAVVIRVTEFGTGGRTRIESYLSNDFGLTIGVWSSSLGSPCSMYVISVLRNIYSVQERDAYIGGKLYAPLPNTTPGSGIFREVLHLLQFPLESPHCRLLFFVHFFL